MEFASRAVIIAYTNGVIFLSEPSFGGLLKDFRDGISRGELRRTAKPQPVRLLVVVLSLSIWLYQYSWQIFEAQIKETGVFWRSALKVRRSY
jgi:uncharacterized membrane protein YbaN (DUF454 family)